MTILVTGAGLIGTHTARALLDQGTGVVLYDPNPSLSYIESVVGADRKLFRVERGDVRDFPRIMELILRLGVTRILHTAAVVGPGADENPGQAFQVNVAGTWNIIEATRIRSLARLVLVSSNSVYANGDGPPDQTLHENTPYHEPDSYYGASKAMAEVMALAYHRLAGVNLVICRPCAVYGRGGYVGGSKSGNAINETLMEALEATQGSRVEVDVPTAERVYVKDVAIALREALFVEKLSTRVYNVGSAEIVTAAMIADAIHGALPHVNTVASFSPPSSVRLLDTTLARSELGYEPHWPLARAIPDYIADLRQFGRYQN
jgi:nucleoside-diphosphate-sugar epimerase